MNMKTLSILSLPTVALLLGACASQTPVQSGNWNFPGEQVAVVPQKPLMRLATLPMNPPPPTPYADVSEEPTRFLFKPRIVLIDEETGAVVDPGDAAFADSGAEE